MACYMLFNVKELNLIISKDIWNLVAGKKIVKCLLQLLNDSVLP
jgi:hypothetical protein